MYWNYDWQRFIHGLLIVVVYSNSRLWPPSLRHGLKDSWRATPSSYSSMISSSLPRQNQRQHVSSTQRKPLQSYRKHRHKSRIICERNSCIILCPGSLRNTNFEQILWRRDSRAQRMIMDLKFLMLPEASLRRGQGRGSQHHHLLLNAQDWRWLLSLLGLSPS